MFYAKLQQPSFALKVLLTGNGGKTHTPTLKTKNADGLTREASSRLRVFATITENITRLVGKNRENHYGGRPGRMTTDTVLLLVDKLKLAWRKGKVLSISFLDAEADLCNAVTDRLLHNLHQ